VAGCDTSWPAGSIYAGMPTLYLELSRGPNQDKNPPGIGIVSARPEQLASAFPDLEYEFSSAADIVGIDAKLWGKIRVTLPGKFEDNAHLHTLKRFTDYGNTKIDNVLRFAKNSTNAGYCVIFVGDNGQGDQYAGVQMLKNNPAVVAVFIHNVTGVPILESETPENLFLFRTYPEAAWIAYQNGFIPKDAVKRVIEGAQKSIQYQQCLDCLNPVKPCLLEETVPQWNRFGGGCTELFYGIAQVNVWLGESALELPSLKIARLPLQESVGFFGYLFSCFFWWVLLLALAVAIPFYLDRHLKPKTH